MVGEDSSEATIEDRPDTRADDDADDAAPSTPWTRRYPPLLSLLAGLLIAVAVMPSALNLPQNNPTQTVEFAPVPPEDSDDPPPPDGNFNQLGLGSSSGLQGDGEGGDGAGTTTVPSALQSGRGLDPSTKRCVAGRQTEDPLSPPCVAFFDGDNFGETYQGVSAEEIKLLIFLPGNINNLNTSRGSEVRPQRTYVDLVADPPTPDDHVAVRVLRGWQKYFNDRYQTYGRFVHFYVYFGAGDQTAEARRADAADNYTRIKPFSVIIESAFTGGNNAYLDSMLKRGVLTFGSFSGQSATFYSRFPKLLWGYLPSLEIQAAQYADVLCRKYVPHPVDHSTTFNGQPREFGLVYTSDTSQPGLREFKDEVMRRFEACGGQIDPDNIATFPQAGYAVSSSQSPRYAVDAMARFQQNDVTTIIWPGGLETRFSNAAAQLGYYPEWIVAGDGFTDAEYPNAVQHQAVWANAVTVSNRTYVPDDGTQQICFQAYRSVDPQAPRRDIDPYACDWYNDLRQFFIGVQVAGPRLGPTAIDKGFHAIPAVPSDNAQVPACYYLPGDFTCIKDVVIARYNPNGRPGSSAPGCYQFAEARRYLDGRVPDGNATAQMRPTDPCLGYDTGQQIDPGAPDPGAL